MQKSDIPDTIPKDERYDGDDLPDYPSPGTIPVIVRVVPPALEAVCDALK